MNDGLPLSSLLSQALVALIIELDNEAEHRMPHWTTNDRPDRAARVGPWLVSTVMWSTCLRFVDEAGVTAAELERRARTPTNVAGMRRWGYIRIDADGRIRPTAHGRLAATIWEPLFAIIEARWRERFGAAAVDRLRAALAARAARLEVELPDCLPILGYGLFSDRIVSQPRAEVADERACASLTLSTLLSKALLAFAIAFERRTKISLAIAANVLRLVGTDGIRVRDLPRRSGVSKEAIAMATGYLERNGYAAIGPEAPGSRVKRLTLTARGLRAQGRCRTALADVETRWRERFGAALVAELRSALEALVGPSGGASPLRAGLVPYPDNWRSGLPAPDELPHYPMVLHRGGYPDGS
jgi:DNA-binding MarR family transcriptional regulator